MATTNSTGVITGRYVYSPYGELTRVGTSPVPLFAYTGRQYDPETGLYQYRARYYHPRLGVFLSTDPVGTKDDPNLYLYVGLDPVNRVDPTGERDVIISVYRNQVSIVVPVVYGGTANSPARQAIFQQEIVNAWGGTRGPYEVSVSFRAPLPADPVGPNYVNFENLGPYAPSTVAAGTIATINVQSLGIPHGEEAHEGGHLMGNGDRYRDNGLTGAARRSVPDTGYENNIMGRLGAGAIVEDRNIDEAIRYPNNSVTRELEEMQSPF